MELFLKVVRKDPIIFRAYYFEAYFAIGTEDEIPWPFGSFKRDIGITDRTFQFLWHGWPPLSLIDVLLFEIEEKIKSPLCSKDVKKLISPTVKPAGRVDFGGEIRGERILIFFSCIIIPIYMKMMESKGGANQCLDWVCLKLSSSW
jgi:hypothetical protein